MLPKDENNYHRHNPSYSKPMRPLKICSLFSFPEFPSTIHNTGLPSDTNASDYGPILNYSKFQLI